MVSQKYYKYHKLLLIPWGLINWANNSFCDRLWCLEGTWPLTGKRVRILLLVLGYIMSFQLINFHYSIPVLKKNFMWMFWPHKPDVGVTSRSFTGVWSAAVFCDYYGSLLLEYSLCLANAHFLHSHRFQSIFLICSPSLNPVLKGFCLCFLSPTGCSSHFSKWRQAPHWT